MRDREPPLNVRPDRAAREKVTALFAATKNPKLTMTNLISAILRAVAADPDRWLLELKPYWEPKRRGRPPKSEPVPDPPKSLAAEPVALAVGSTTKRATTPARVGYSKDKQVGKSKG